MNERALPKRRGSRPRTTPTNPHSQLEQNPQRQVVDELARRVFALPDVEERPSAISVPGARALWLREDVPAGPPEAFVIEREFAHIHPMPDGSLHAALLPQKVAQEPVEKGWAESNTPRPACLRTWGDDLRAEGRRGDRGCRWARGRSLSLRRWRGALHRMALVRGEASAGAVR